MTIWNYMSLYIYLQLAKDAKLLPKATRYKPYVYIYLRPKICFYLIEYILAVYQRCGTPSAMQAWTEEAKSM